MINMNIKNQAENLDLNNLDAIYFIGIGGIGVSALAFWCIERNIKVFGYDREKNNITNKIQLQGGEVFYDYNILSGEHKSKSRHFAVLNSFVKNSNSIVVFSAAIKINHPIRSFFDFNKVKSIKRADFLGLISANYKVVAIAGTHGKTTISTILTHLLKTSGNDCTAFLGGVSKNYESNFVLGSNNIMVIEADEYDKSFLHLKANIILISSIDKDHSDTYPTYLDMYNSYIKFVVNSLPNLSNLIIKKNIILQSEDLPEITEYSLSETADYNLNFRDNKLGGLELTFLEKNKKTNNFKKLKTFNVSKQPEHNLENFLAASIIALKLGVNINDIAKGITSFLGVKRRFEYHINTKKQIFIEDYAHHPEEINVLIGSLRKMFEFKKITMIFQPHLFSRTKDFLNEFAVSLSKVDTLVLLDIYPARELPIKGFSINKLFGLIKLEDKVLVSKEKLIPLISKLKPELLLSVGAGDITIYSEELKRVLL